MKTCISILFMLAVYLIQGCGFLETEQEKAERYYQSGLAAIGANKSEEAQIHLQNALQINPYHAQAHYRLGALHMERDQVFLAVLELSTAVKQDPNLREAIRALAVLSHRSEAYKQTVSFCRDFIDKWGDDREILILWGDSLLRLNQIPESKQVLERAVGACPDDPDIRFLLARVFLAEKHPDEARKMLETAAALRKSSISVQISLAGFYETTALHAEAEAKYSLVCRDFPKDPSAFLAAAEFYLRSDRLDEAEKMIRQAFHANLRDPRLYQTMAHIQHGRKDYESALASLKAGVVAASSPADEQRGMMLLAEYFVFLNDIPMALSAYEKLLQKWPQVVAIKTRIAELLLAENRYEEAQQRIDRILAEHSDSAGGHLLQGLLKLKDGQVAEARKEFFTSCNLSPESAEARYLYGLTFLVEQNYKISISEMMAALEKDPNSWLSRMALALIYFKQEKFYLALNVLEKLITEKPENYRAKSLRAAVYQHMGNYSYAVSDYSEIIEKNPKLHELALFRFRLAETLRNQGELDESLKEFTAILDSYPQPVRPLEKIIRIHLAEGRHEKALAICEDYLTKEPGNLEAGLMKAEILMHYGAYEDAEEYLAALIRKNPDSDGAVVLMAKLNRLQADFDAAMKMFQRAVQINPDHVEAHMSLAAVYQRNGEFEKALETYEDLLKKGFFAPAANDLAYLYANLNQNLERALELAIKAYMDMPRSPDVADTLGLVHLKKKSLLMAKKYIKEALQARPDDPLFQYHMGLAEYEENDFEETIKSMQTAIKSGLEKGESENAQKVMREAEAVQGRLKTGEAHMEKGEFDQAIQLYEGLMRTKGFCAPAAIGLAHAYCEKGADLDHALDLATKAQSHLPGNAEAVDIMGWILLKKGSHLLAKKYFHEAIRIQPKAPKFHYHLGIALHGQKNFIEAEKELATAIQLGLSDEELADVRKMLSEK